MKNAIVTIHKSYELTGAYSGYMREVSWRVDGDFKFCNCPTPKMVRNVIQRLMDARHAVKVVFA